MFKLKGNRVLITGGSRGIGLGYAMAFAKQGCSIVLVHHQDSEKARCEIGKLLAMGAKDVFELDTDIADLDASIGVMEEVVGLLGGIDIMISNSGICEFTPYLDLTPEIWKRHMDVNLNGAFMITQLASKQMIKQKSGGRIIFTTSVGAFRSNAAQTHYCATKGGLNILSMGMALELGEYNITVNSIAPGWIHTDINDRESRDTESVEPWINSHIATGRLGQPSDHESAVLFLASKEAAYTTGSTIFVDGGWNAQL